MILPIRYREKTDSLPERQGADFILTYASAEVQYMKYL